VRRVVDIAGVAVELRADDAPRARALADAVAGFELTTVAPVVSLRLGAVPRPAPPRPPDDERFGRRLWLLPGGAQVAAGDDVGLVVRGDRAEGWLGEGGDAESFEPLVGLALCWLLAREGRYLLHGAAVALDGHAIIALGHSGAGKSSLGLAALDGGLELLTDDLAVVEPRGGELLVHGVHQAPAPPRELGGALLDGTTGRGDHRQRARLDVGLLTPGPRTLTGVVLVGHSDEVSGELERRPGHDAMPLLLQSFVALADPAHRAPYLPVAAWLASLPVWRLGHGTDASTRRRTSAEHLWRCLRESRALSGAAR
jgi:hypothetical protein